MPYNFDSAFYCTLSASYCAYNFFLWCERWCPSLLRGKNVRPTEPIEPEGSMNDPHIVDYGCEFEEKMKKQKTKTVIHFLMTLGRRHFLAVDAVWPFVAHIFSLHSQYYPIHEYKYDGEAHRFRCGAERSYSIRTTLAFETTSWRANEPINEQKMKMNHRPAEKPNNNDIFQFTPDSNVQSGREQYAV